MLNRCHALAHAVYLTHRYFTDIACSQHLSGTKGELIIIMIAKAASLRCSSSLCYTLSLMQLYNLAFVPLECRLYLQGSTGFFHAMLKSWEKPMMRLPETLGLAVAPSDCWMNSQPLITSHVVTCTCMSKPQACPGFPQWKIKAWGGYGLGMVSDHIKRFTSHNKRMLAMKV